MGTFILDCQTNSTEKEVSQPPTGNRFPNRQRNNMTPDEDPHIPIKIIGTITGTFQPSQSQPMTPTPRTDADDRQYPLPEHAQRIQFEGCECVVMAPEDYEALYEHARQLERELEKAKADPRNMIRCQGCGRDVTIVHRTAPIGTDPANWRCSVCILQSALTAHKAALARVEAHLKRHTQRCDWARHRSDPTGLCCCPFDDRIDSALTELNKSQP